LWRSFVPEKCNLISGPIRPEDTSCVARTYRLPEYRLHWRSKQS